MAAKDEKCAQIYIPKALLIGVWLVQPSMWHKPLHPMALNREPSKPKKKSLTSNLESDKYFVARMARSAMLSN
eukprot:6925261-Karenia_brevis.AAC.1